MDAVAIEVRREGGEGGREGRGWYGLVRFRSFHAVEENRDEFR